MKTRFIIAVWFLVSGVAFAQTETGINKLTYKEAIKIAREKNVNLNQQKNFLESRQVARNASIAALGPNLSINGNGSRNIGQQPNPTNGDLENLTVDNYGASINAQMTLFNGLSRVNQLHANISAFKAQSAFVKRSEQDAIFNVTLQFLQVLLDQELLKIAEENFRTQQTVLEQISEAARLGQRAEADVYNQDAQAKNMEVTAIRAKVTLDNDKATLAQMLQQDPSIPFEVEFPVALAKSSPTLSLDSLYSIAEQNRPDLKQLQYQVEANHALLRAATAAYFPTVTGFVSYGSNYYPGIRNNNYGTDDNPQYYGGLRNQFMTVFPNTTYGVNVTIPIFNRLATRNNRVFNKVTYDNSKLQLENLEKTIKIDVQRSYNNYQAAIKGYNASLAQFQSGELALKTQQESFLLGIANQVTLAQANQTYVQAAASRAQAEVTLLFQSIFLDYALGTLKFDDIE
jgi:outer membrane protein